MLRMSARLSKVKPAMARVCREHGGKLEPEPAAENTAEGNAATHAVGIAVEDTPGGVHANSDHFTRDQHFYNL